MFKNWSSPFLAVLIALPGLVLTLLVHDLAVDSPFFDDFTFLEDWIKYKSGTLHFSDLFTAHMEHRVVLPRFMALGLHLVLGRDLRWQNLTTLLLLWGTGWNLLRIFGRTTGAALRSGWIPLLAMSALLFCAIQWQAILWPICFEIFLPMFFFTLGINFWIRSQKPTRAFVISALGAIGGTVSFANGALIWPLMLPALWWLRDDLARSQRHRLIGAWLVIAAVTIVLYTHRFSNSAPGQFAYGQGNDVTVEHSARYFVGNLDKAAGFISALLGCHLSRGLHLQNIVAAQCVGGVSFVAYLTCLAIVWWQRKDTPLLKSTLPWLMLGAFSIGTATMIAIGRMWLTKSGSLAITVRYVTHAIPLTLALIALAFILGRRFAQSAALLPKLGLLACGIVLMLTGMEWVYGSRNMELWREARLQGEALLLFTDVIPSKGFLGPVSGDGDYGARIMSDLNRLHLLRQPLLSSLDLHQFHVSSADLRPRLGQFKMLQQTKEGELITDGFAELPNQRPADLIIFSWSPNPGVDTIFGIATLERIPRYFAECSYRDYEFLSVTPFGPDVICQWSESVSFASLPPQGAKITAWALDVEKKRIFRIDDARALPSARLPKGIYRNSENQAPEHQ